MRRGSRVHEGVRIRHRAVADRGGVDGAGQAHRRAVSRPGGAGRRGAGPDPAHADAGPGSSARADPVRRARAARLRLRCFATRSAGELAGRGLAGDRRRRAVDPLRGLRGALAGPGHVVGGGDRARGHRCPARRLRRHRGAETAPPAASGPGGPGRGEPVQRRERAPRLSPRAGSGHGGRAACPPRAPAARVHDRGQRGAGDRAGVWDSATDRAGRRRRHRHHASVLRRLRGLDQRRSPAPVGHPHHGRVRDDRQSAGPVHARAPARPVLRGLGLRGLRAQCPGLHPDRLPAEGHHRPAGDANAARIPRGGGGGLRAPRFSPAWRGCRWRRRWAAFALGGARTAANGNRPKPPCRVDRPWWSVGAACAAS